MKKLINFLLILVLAVVSTTCLFACNDDEGNESQAKVGFSYTLKSDNGRSYLSVKNYGISEADAKKVASGNYSDILQSITIPEKAEYNGTEYDVEEIEPSAFANQLVIKSVVIPASIKTIGSACLSGCTSLESLTVPFAGNKVGAVNDGKVLGYLFGSSEVANATSTTVSYNATGTKTYYVPNSLKKITLNGDVTDYAFNGLANVEEIVVTGNTENIGVAAFKGCSSLYKLSLNQKAKVIGDSAFEGCTTLISFDFSAATTIGASAFSGCTLLAYNPIGAAAIALPASLTSLGEKAFNGCTSIASVDLSALTADSHVGSFAFMGCTALENVSLSASASYGSNVFNGCDALKETGVTANSYSYAGTGLFDFAV